jgi:outer membrane receptor protein involved in Fe transport
VATTGAELSVRRVIARGAFLQAGYTRTALDADTISTLCGAPACLSKYVLEYAPHAFTVAALVPLPAGVRVAPRLEYRHRRRNAATTDDAVLDLRVSRAFGRYEVRLDGTNLADTDYQEIAGVAMPGRAATITLAVR